MIRVFRLHAYLVLFLSLLWLASEPSGFAAREESTDLPADLARIPVKWEGMVSVRVADLWNSALAKGARERLGKDADFFLKTIQSECGFAPSEIERWTEVVPLLKGAAGSVRFLQTVRPFDAKKTLATLAPGAVEKKYNGQSYFFTPRNTSFVILGPKTLISGPTGDIQSLLDQNPKDRKGALADLVTRAAGKHMITWGGHLKGLAELENRAPPEAAPYLPLLKLQLAIVSMDFGEVITAQMNFRFNSADEAKAAIKSLEAARKLWSEMMKREIAALSKDKSAKLLGELMTLSRSKLDNAKVVQTNESLSVNVSMKVDNNTVGALAVDAVTRMRVAAARTQSMNNLKQIGLALHNYHDANGAFPPAAIYDKDGKPILSWRVLILPYIEQDALYKKFKLDEPWDGPNNKKLLASMPRTYASPTAKNPKPGYTHYLAFFGKNAAWEGKRGLKLQSFTDGTSNTVLVAESEPGVPWSKPDDIPFDPAKAVPKVGGLMQDGFLTLFGDGSVRFIKQSIKAANLKALITRNGGEVIGSDD